MEKKYLYLDFDGVIVNTVKAIVDLYNEDFQYYKNFVPVEYNDINTWGFVECNCASEDYINHYFNQQRFFDKLEFMDNAKEVIEKLSDKFNITIVSTGYSPNLKAKELWIKKNLPFCKFIGVNLKKHKDKSHIDMSNGIFIDDYQKNLFTSNALLNICFDEKRSWNKDWQGFRITNWLGIEKYLLNCNYDL